MTLQVIKGQQEIYKGLVSGDPNGGVCEGEGAARALSCPSLFCIPHGAPLRLAAHLGRSISSSLLSPLARLGLRRLGDSTDLGWAGGGEGGMAGCTPSLPKAVQESRGGTRWVTFRLPRGWHLQMHGCCFSPALLQDLASQPQSPTSSPTPPRARFTHACLPTAAPFRGQPV